jgi:uncharacterized protein
VTLIVDAAPIIAAADETDSMSASIRALLNAESGSLVVPAPVSAEIDYLLRRRLGERAARAFLTDVAARRFDVVGLTHDEHGLAHDLDERYSDLGLGLADASVVVLADRFRTRRILSFDERHFRAVTGLDGHPLTILPYDEPEAVTP